jgi:hypothetical protein
MVEVTITTHRKSKPVLSARYSLGPAVTEECSADSIDGALQAIKTTLEDHSRELEGHLMVANVTLTFDGDGFKIDD